MSTNLTNLFPIWTAWEGFPLNLDYVLGPCFAASDSSGCYQALPQGSIHSRCFVQLVALHSNIARHRLLSWEQARQFAHPNVIQIFACGLAERDGLEVAYCVFEAYDETLAAGLEERALAAEEAQQVLESAAQGLAFLHARGFVHTAIEPANILAVGETIKLSSDAVLFAEAEAVPASNGTKYQAPEVPTNGYSPEADMWSLGSTLFEALTRELPAWGNASFGMDSLPAPFSLVLPRCLAVKPSERWSAAHVLEALHPATSPNVTNEDVTKEHVTKEPGAELGSIPRPNDRTLTSPAEASVEAATVPAYERRRATIDQPSRRSWGSYAMIASVLLIGLLWLLFRKTPNREAPATPSVQSAPLAAVVPNPSAPATASKRARSDPKSHIATAVPSPNSPVNWRVVAFTFNSSLGAERKAQTVNARTPSLHADVFSPEPGRYLVCLGGWMTNEDSLRVRRKALALGLPRDTYAQNFRR